MLTAILVLGIIGLGISWANYRSAKKAANSKVCCRRKTDCNK